VEVCAVGSERRGNVGAAGRPKRARCRKRRIQPRNAYSAPASFLLGEISGYSANVNCGKSVSGETGDIGKSSSSSF
jgi:hypothetical protein